MRAIFDQDKMLKQQAWQLPIFIDTYDIVSLQRIQNPVLWDCYSALKHHKIKSNQEPNEISNQEPNEVVSPEVCGGI